MSIFSKPTLNGDYGTWGTKLNSNWDKMEVFNTTIESNLGFEYDGTDKTSGICNIFGGNLEYDIDTNTLSLTGTFDAPTITSPLINGEASGTSVSTTPTANKLVKYDANGGITANKYTANTEIITPKIYTNTVNPLDLGDSAEVVNFEVTDTTTLKDLVVTGSVTGIPTGSSVVDSIPVGTTLQGLWDINNIPEGFIPLNGASLQPTVFPELFEHYKKNNLIDTNITIKNNSGANLIVHYKNGGFTLATDEENSTLKLNQFYNSSVDKNLLLTLDNIKNGLLEITSFTLQDARGLFLRNIDNGAGVDIDRTTVGSIQQDELKEHIHQFKFQMRDEEGNGGMPKRASYNGGGVHYSNYWYTDTTGGVETRPKNIAVECIIKYKLGDGRLS